MFPRLGIQTKFIDGDKPEDFKAAIDDKTKAIYVSVWAFGSCVSGADVNVARKHR
jgi:O-acetylhomoserine/O-acetylserine sulfhydrylase-like pyridoxal-dependent enzyme